MARIYCHQKRNVSGGYICLSTKKVKRIVVKVTRIRAGFYAFDFNVWDKGILKNEEPLGWKLYHSSPLYTGIEHFRILREAKTYLIEYYNQEKK